MVRPTKEQLNGRDTAEVIYQNAIDLMFQGGFHGTSLRDVARAVGVQMSTLYYYFDSKQDLLVSIMTRTTEDLTQVVRASITEEDSPLEQLEAAIKAHVVFHADRAREARVTDTELRSLEPANLKTVVAMRDEYESIFRNILVAGQKNGEFAKVDIKVAVRALLVSITDVATWYTTRGRLSLKNVARTYTQVFVEGLRAR